MEEKYIVFVSKWYIVETQMPRGIVYEIPQQDFENILTQSTSWKSVLSKCRFKANPDTCKHPKNVNQFSGNHKMRIKKRAHELKIDISHLKDGYEMMRKHRSDLKPNSKKDKSQRRKRVRLLKRLKDVDRLEICEWCRCENMELKDGKWMWYDRPLTLHIDHIKGLADADSDEPEFLRFLCPLCHSQTHNIHKNIKSYSDPLNTTTHGKKLLKSGREYICTNCKCADMTLYNGRWHWRDWPIKLECNHINGRKIQNADHVDNLEWLCSACHSQHTAKNRQKRIEEHIKATKA